MTPNQEQEQRTNAAFKNTQRPGAGTLSARKKAEQDQAAAFRSAIQSGKIRRANPKAPLAKGCTQTAREQADGARSAVFAGVLAVAKTKARAGKKLANPTPGACRMVANPTARQTMLKR